MILSTFSILVIIALIFTVVSFIWPSYPLLPVAVLLIAIALLVSPK